MSIVNHLTDNLWTSKSQTMAKPIHHKWKVMKNGSIDFTGLVLIPQVQNAFVRKSIESYITLLMFLQFKITHQQREHRSKLPGNTLDLKFWFVTTNQKEIYNKSKKCIGIVILEHNMTFLWNKIFLNCIYLKDFTFKKLHFLAHGTQFN